MTDEIITKEAAEAFIASLPEEERYPELLTDLLNGFVYPWDRSKKAQAELKQKWSSGDGAFFGYIGFERLSKGCAVPDEYEVWYDRIRQGKLVQYHGPTGGAEHFLLSTGDDVLYWGILGDADFALQNTNEILLWDKELGITVWACCHSGEPLLVDCHYRELSEALEGI